MDQRIATPSQQKWLTKLMGYDYEIKSGHKNKTADELSRTIIQDKEADPNTHYHCSWQQGLLRRKEKLVVGDGKQLKQKLMPVQSRLPDHDGIAKYPTSVLERILVKGDTYPVVQVFIQCSNSFIEDAAWKIIPTYNYTILNFVPPLRTRVILPEAIDTK
ncbi:hypothetical protein ACH5RR_033312 [Cinchona calisaya]|uniref:Uncharacterized protein n=1 Tax=Cinchona calisaya TaxID=153742 RepID=A0ABD2YP59_9GENT